MATKNTVWLIADSTNYYLSGGAATQTIYTGSGTPWTAESTSPYEIAQNEVLGSWTPTVAEARTLSSGGVPFSNIGAVPIYQSYDNVVETLGIQMRATTHNNAVALLRQLRQLLNRPPAFVPAVLAVTSGSNTDYSEILRATVQETTSYQTEAGFLIRAQVTWTRRAFFGLLSAGESLASSVAWTNAGTGATDNVIALSTGSGDLIYEGSPLNIEWDPTSGAANYQISQCASIDARTYSVTGAGSLTTSSTSGSAVSVGSMSATNALTRPILKARCMVHATIGSNAQMRVVEDITGYTSPWFSSTGGISRLIDTGPIDLSIIRRTSGSTSPTLGFNVGYRSTDGLSSTVTLTSCQFLLYYDFAEIAHTSLIQTPLYIDSFPEQTNAPCLPYTPIAFWGSTRQPYKGTLPRYFNGCSLWWVSFLANRQYATGDAGTITVRHAPLWRSLRGAS